MTGQDALPPILLVGGGKMGSAMLTGWRELGVSRVVVIDPAPEAAALAGPSVTVASGPKGLPADFHPAAIVLAIKPQLAAVLVPAYSGLAKGAVCLSIMAGQTIAKLTSLLHSGAVVRAMPNTPAAVRQGFSVACAGPGVDAAGRGLCDRLLGAVGQVAWVEAEALLDPVTAISGGGPAYVFLLAELLEQAGVELGLPGELARAMARATVAGSGALLAASSEDAAVLRRNVTSPAGTTERALAVLMAPDAWPAAVRAAMAAAAARSRELAG